MATTTVAAIVLERDGEHKTAYPATDEQLREAAAYFQTKGMDINGCNCGDEICYNGYVWRCAYGPSGECQWFSSDWGCNG